MERARSEGNEEGRRLCGEDEKNCEGSQGSTAKADAKGVSGHRDTTDAIRRRRLPHPHEGFEKTEERWTELEHHRPQTGVGTPAGSHRNYGSYVDISSRHTGGSRQPITHGAHSRKAPPARSGTTRLLTQVASSIHAH
jgi:hypothetical protein